MSGLCQGFAVQCAGDGDCPTVTCDTGGQASHCS
jgi:hypothetical protein